tara:strand:+ start:3425 stop:4273 length:849 start_codon:yes stop_codon:yes gene_type:complete
MFYKTKNKLSIQKYLDNHPNLSDKTRETYLYNVKNLTFDFEMLSQVTLLNNIKKKFENPNSRSMHLNLLILMRKQDNLQIDKLLKYRDTLREEIIVLRKENLAELELPTFEEFKEKLDKSQGLRYLINYLFFNFGFRNKDINLKIIKKEKNLEDYEFEQKYNYLIVNKHYNAQLIINEYKTKKSFGKKIIAIKDPKFLREIKKLDLVGNFLLSTKLKKQLVDSTFNERVKSLTIDELGEVKIFKILIAHYLKNQNFDKIEALSKSRGTSLTTILRSYNTANT